MVQRLVLYEHPKDTAAFDKYYHEVHIPLAKRMQGLSAGFEKVDNRHRARHAGRNFVTVLHDNVTELYVDSRADFDTLLASPEGQAAVADVPNVATAA
jgi:uncharacterized protein (TIGR02118 family)